jgi:hypothetical protein
VHDNCANCLGAGPRFEYRNWKAATFGQAMALEHERQVSGERNIVVGGMGEAEVKNMQPGRRHTTTAIFLIPGQWSAHAQ